MERTCEYCDRQFTLRKNLFAHLRNIHKVEPNFSDEKQLCCSLCDSYHKTYEGLRDHYVETHNKEIFKETKIFSSLADFLSWKDTKEKEMQCSYVKETGTKTSNGNKRSYFICHRSGCSKDIPVPSTRKAPRSQGRVKMGSCCPSTLELRECTESEVFEATLFTPHIGHECSLKYVNLSKAERAEIAGKIQQGISFDRILDDIRGSLNMEQSVERIHLLSRQDLRNIEKEFLLKSESQLHRNDPVSVDLWVQQMSKFSDCSPVLFYKPQGQVSESEMFQIDDFVLMVMTSAQESLLKQFGNRKICIDSTHGTNQYDFQLTSLLVVDEYGEGIPVAFLFSNHVDTNTLTHFFNVLKSKVGPIKCEVFMSDDAPEFYNAWTNVMEHPEHRLLCIWHVDRNWRNQLKKVQGDQTLKVLVYKSIRMVMETTDENEFCKVLDSVLNELLSTENTKLFGKYFKEYYAGRPECWAYCYRRGLGINTNMYLESMHKTLKHVYLEGKTAKRMDKCIWALMKLVRDKLFDHLRKKIKGKQTYRLKEINDRHRRGMLIAQNDIVAKDENVWDVKSERSSQYYTVKMMNNLCSDDGCELVCKDCRVCVHMFTCECSDYYIRCNLCKHIHSVCSMLGTVRNVPKVLKTTTVGLNETVQHAHKLIAEHNNQMHDSNEGIDSNDRIKSKLNYLLAHVSNTKLDAEHALKLERALDVAIGLCQSGTPVSNREPSNKNVNRQIRFESTKKRQKPNHENALSKPSLVEKLAIKDLLSGADDDTDHLYCKRQKIFE